MKTPKDTVVSASPAPKGEAMFFCGDCSAPYKLDGQAWPQMWYPTCLHKNPMFRPPAFAAAQPVAANSKVEDTLPRNKWTPCPICKSDYDGKFCHACRNEPVELVMQLIDATASTGAYFTSEEFKEQLAAILGPFFTQVSQLPQIEEKQNEQCSISSSTRNGAVDGMGSEAEATSDGWMLFAGKLVRVIKDEEINRAQYMLACELRKLASVPPVSGPQPENNWPVCKSCGVSHIPLANCGAVSANGTEPPELDWTKCGIVELAARNPNVASYIEHWEGRTQTSEAEVVRLREVLDKIRKFAHGGAISLSVDAGEFATIRNEAEAALAGAASHNGQGWVRVEDRLPEVSGDYIAVFKSGTISGNVHWNAGKKKWGKNITGDADWKITHWQPLPAPPSEANGPQDKEEK